MDFQNYDQLSDEELQKLLLEYQTSIQNLDTEEMLDKLVKALDSTELILEGYNLVTNINEGHGIAVAAIIRLRDAISEAITWIDFNCNDNSDEVDSDEL